MGNAHATFLRPITDAPTSAAPGTFPPADRLKVRRLRRVNRMTTRKIVCLVAAAVALGMACMGLAAGGGTPAERRAAAHKAFDAGNFNDAYKVFAALATDPNDDPTAAPEDLNYALMSLQRLGRADEIDAVREKVVATHPKNWRLLSAAAQSFQQGEPYGVIVAGQFYRGGRPGGDGRQGAA